MLPIIYWISNFVNRPPLEYVDRIVYNIHRPTISSFVNMEPFPALCRDISAFCSYHPNPPPPLSSQTIFVPPITLHTEISGMSILHHILLQHPTPYTLPLLHHPPCPTLTSTLTPTPTPTLIPISTPSPFPHSRDAL